MDAGRGFDPQPPSGVQTTSPEQANHPLQGCVSQLDALSYSSTPGCIGNSEHKINQRNRSTTRQTSAFCGRRLFPVRRLLGLRRQFARQLFQS
jgi:hypothetical protein